MERYNFGYFATLQTQEMHMGCLMVTDHLLIPMEFKYTEPIKPTKIHKIIFGKTLEKYITEEVIKKSLLKEIKHLPAVIFVPEIKLLSDATVGKIPMVALEKTTLPELGNVAETQRIKDKEVIIQSVTSKNPLKLTFVTPETEAQEKVINIIKAFIEKIDLYEPFSRLETALKTLCQ